MKYIPTIGIETHVQLKTKTKLFAAVGNDARNAKPNTLISHICVGMPGALPYLNEKAIELTAKAAFALNTEPQKFSKFDRKHYFYPDLPKGYQITQYEQPLILGGHVDIEVDGEQKRINITRAHLEEDAGKNTHPAGADYSLVDLNRAGTPLLEIVSEPEIHSAAEAKAYAHELYLLMKYAGVSDVDLYHGNMRFDVNVSVSASSTPGTRTETKNLNSFKSIEATVEYEIARQIDLLEKGEKIVQETRGWDEAKQKTTSQRGKEKAHDYRYMPEPDVPPVELDEDYIEGLKKDLPIMPGQWRDLLKPLGLDKSATETLLESEAAEEKTSYLQVIKEFLDNPGLAKHAVNYIINTQIPAYTDTECVRLSHDMNKYVLQKIFELLSEDKLSSTNAKALYAEFVKSGNAPSDIAKHAKEEGYIQVSDEGEIDKIVAEVLGENPKAAEDIKNGEQKAIGFLVGQVMKKSAGKANPQMAQELIKKHLSI